MDCEQIKRVIKLINFNAKLEKRDKDICDLITK